MLKRRCKAAESKLDCRHSIILNRKKMRQTISGTVVKDGRKLQLVPSECGISPANQMQIEG